MFVHLMAYRIAGGVQFTIKPGGVRNSHTVSTINASTISARLIVFLFFAVVQMRTCRALYGVVATAASAGFINFLSSSYYN